MDFKQILKGLATAALAILIASNTASSIHYESTEALLVAAILLGIFNIFLKPLLMLFSLPFIVFTFGLGIWIINALLFLLVAFMVNGFYVDSFTGALWGAFLLSVINLLATLYFGDPKNRKFTFRMNQSGHVSGDNRRFQSNKTSRNSEASIKDDDVIDV